MKKRLMAALLMFALVFTMLPVSVGAEGISVYLGVDYSPVYDFDFYVNYNQDLTGAFGDDPAGALNHFVNYGMAEGRRANASFDVYAYMAAYGDLPAAFGSDLRAYYLHYINYGLSEGRSGLGNGQASVPAVPATPAAGETSAQTPDSDASASAGSSSGSQTPAAPETGSGSASAPVSSYLTVLDGVDYAPVYDFNYYISRNADVKAVLGMDQTAVLKHFVDWGMGEGRQGNADFNVYVYHDRYGDIQKVLGEDWKAIYMHYLNWGIAEGRSGSGQLPAGSGSSAGTPAKTTVKPKAVTVYEGIDYSPVYDYDYYLAHHADVKQYLGTDPETVLEHFVKWGMNEHRQASENFDVMSYRNAYQDLRKALKLDWAAYYKHYLDYGIQEGRNKTTGISTLQNPVTVYKDVDLSPIYDYYYYCSSYPEVAKTYSYDDTAMLKYCATTGIHEGQKAKASFDQKIYDQMEELFPHYDYPRAEEVLNQVGWDLRAAFNWSSRLSYIAADLPKEGSKGINFFADWGYDHHSGNCYCYAATFTQMARLLGYDARQTSGGIRTWSGGLAAHSWVEIDQDGQTYVYDPEYQHESGNDGFANVYGQSGRWKYVVNYYMEDE